MIEFRFFFRINVPMSKNTPQHAISSIWIWGRLTLTNGLRASLFLLMISIKWFRMDLCNRREKHVKAPKLMPLTQLRDHQAHRFFQRLFAILINRSIFDFSLEWNKIKTEWPKLHNFHFFYHKITHLEAFQDKRKFDLNIFSFFSFKLLLLPLSWLLSRQFI